jgi:hypothetical protein
MARRAGSGGTDDTPIELLSSRLMMLVTNIVDTRS